MTILSIAALFAMLSGALAFSAEARFRDQRRLPMQWSWTGEVTWSAPRRPALLLFPALTVVMLGAFYVMSMVATPRAGQEGEVVPVLIALGSTLLAVQFLHLWLVAGHLRRTGG